MAKRANAHLRAWLAPECRAGRQRGLASQLERRKADEAIRRYVVERLARLAQGGIPRVVRAKLLGIADSTLFDWERSLGQPVKARGREAQRGTRELRDGLLAFLRAAGPQVGVPTLKRIFSGLARRQIEELKLRFRRLVLTDDQLLVHELEWTHPGTVWAMDFTEPPLPIDGLYRFVLVVRDLASGYTLMAPR